MAHEIVIYGPRAVTVNSVVDFKVLDAGHSKHTTNALDFQTFYQKICTFYGHDFYTLLCIYFQKVVDKPDKELRTGFSSPVRPEKDTVAGFLASEMG